MQGKNKKPPGTTRRFNNDKKTRLFVGLLAANGQLFAAPCAARCDHTTAIR